MATEISGSQASLQDASRASGSSTPAALSVSSSESHTGMGDAELRFREALTLWLRWNEAYEQATRHLFSAGTSPEKVEDFMDSMDQLRRQAISLSHCLLD
jgi:hypothetical protein